MLLRATNYPVHQPGTSSGEHRVADFYPKTADERVLLANKEEFPGRLVRFKIKNKTNCTCFQTVTIYSHSFENITLKSKSGKCQNGKW